MTASERREREGRERTGRSTAESLERKANAIEPRAATSPWADHEYVRGYAVMVLPFSSGHFLALRAWPRSSFGPYVSVWHRSPEGEWSMYSDGPSLETTCPRYWKPITRRAELTDIDVTWTGPNELRVEMDEPELLWTMSMTASSLLRRLNVANASLPLWSWKPASLQRMRESISKHLLDMGDIRLSFTTPNGHDTVIMPEEIFFVDASEASLDGRSLGDPVRLETNPTIGGVPLPTRPTFVLGQAHMRIIDPEEYRRTRDRALEE